MKKSHDEIYTRVGALIRDRRINANLTQDKLATRVGTNRVTLTLIELGQQKATIELLYKLADAFACDVTDFLPARDAEGTAMPQTSRCLDVTITVTYNGEPVILPWHACRSLLRNIGALNEKNDDSHS